MTAAVVVLLGVIAGWYANLIADKVPVGQAFSEPTRCPGCQEMVRGIANVPLIGWFASGGKCQSCGRPVPLRRPIVEAGTGLLFLLTVQSLGIRWVLAAYLVFMLVTVALFLTDLDWNRIPNTILFRGGGAAVGLLALGSLLDGDIGRFPIALAGGLTHFALMLAVALAARGGMGMGDVKLAALLGTFTAYLSWTTLAVSVVTGILLGGLIGVILLVTRRKGRKDEVAYGPPLILGAWLAIIWGSGLGAWMFGA